METPSDDIETVRRLFHEQVPEVASGLIEIRGIARKPGVLSMLVVHSSLMPPLDTVGTCVGPKSSHVREIVKRLGGEALTVVRWAESVEQLISNMVAPNQVVKVSFDDQARVANIVLRSDSEGPGIYKEPPAKQKVRLELASELVGWQIRIRPLQGV